MADDITASGFLDVGDGHRLYWEDWGNPHGTPILHVHGGPGDSFGPSHKALFDADTHRVVFFDQRGCGRSTPFASTEHNTTPHLLADIDRLLDHLGIETAHVAGGSWGSALSLLYAIRRPDRVRSLLVWSVYLIRESENEWINNGHPRSHFPAEWATFISLVPEDSRADGDAVMRYYALRMRSDDPAEAARYALEWARWEWALCSIECDPAELDAELRELPTVLSEALLETHYFTQGCFVPEGFILDNIDRIRSIPCQIVQGRFDMCTPPVSAYDLSRAYGESATLRMVNAGHLRSDPEMSRALREAAQALVGR